MFNGGFEEAANKSAGLPEDDPESFDSFSRWLYRDKLDEMDLSAPKTDSGPLWDRIKLYCFAEKYCIDSLADIAMDTIIPAYSDENFTPSAHSMCLVYDNTSEGSRLRLYMARSFAYRLVCLHVDVPRELLERLASISDFPRDVFSILLKGTPIHPNNLARCNYHRHGKDRICID